MANKNDLIFSLRPEGLNYQYIEDNLYPRNTIADIGFDEDGILSSSINTMVLTIKWDLQGKIQVPYCLIPAINKTSNYIFPEKSLVRYKTLLPNIIKHFIPNFYYSRSLELRYSRNDNAYLGQGLILDADYKPLVIMLCSAERSDIENKLSLSDINVRIDYDIFNKDNSISRFVKNTLIPIFVYYKYPIQITALNKNEIFSTVNSPQSFDFEGEAHKTLMDNIDLVLDNG